MHAALLTPEVESKLRQLSSSARAIGEIGLDYALIVHDRKLQQTALHRQLSIAAEAGLPVLIHCRNAFADLIAILKEHRVDRFGGVMHAFSGSPEVARECIRIGLHISLAGTVTYANAVRPPAVAATVPLERLLLETDAPDLAPEPYRGTQNVPAYLLETARRIATIKGVSLEELAHVTTANAFRLFRIPPDDHRI
jgi:TatD DNase family protein